MNPLRRVLSVLLLVVATTPLQAQSPAQTTLSALDEGVRIRTNGPAVRDLIRPTVNEVLSRGIMSLVIRPPADGVVMSADSESLRFAVSERSRMIDVPWGGVDYVDVHAGRSPAMGALQGAGGGVLAGLMLWGLVELIFIAADNPVVEEPLLIVAPIAGASAVYGAMALGDRWDRVYPGAPGR